jgi:hypothetical protein
MDECLTEHGQRGMANRMRTLLGVTALVAVGAVGCGRTLMPGRPGGNGGGGAAGVTTGSWSGTGGAAFACPPPTSTNPTACGVSACGNGRVDTCAGTGGAGAHGGGQNAEGCDGDDTIVNAACSSMGYASGTITCTADCNLDLSACEECVASAPSVRSCGLVAIPAPSYLYAVAATDTQIGIVWMDATGAGLHFTLLSPDLAVTASIKLPGNPYVSGLAALAPLPSGWMIAAPGADAVGSYALNLHQIAADGSPVASTSIPMSPPPELPVLAARPGAGPILIWMPDFATLRAAAVATDPPSLGTPINLPVDGEPNAHEVNAAFIAGAVHVVTPVDLENNLRPLRIFRILPDVSGASLVGGPSGRLRLPTLVAGASNLELVFQDFNTSQVLWQRLDAAGNPAVPSVNLDSVSQLFGLASAASGDDAMVLVPQSLGARNKYSLMRVRGGSGTVQSTFAYAGDSQPHLVRRGPDLIAAWTGTGSGCDAARIKIARLTP